MLHEEADVRYNIESTRLNLSIDGREAAEYTETNRDGAVNVGSDRSLLGLELVGLFQLGDELLVLLEALAQRLELWKQQERKNSHCQVDGNTLPRHE